MHKHVDKFDAVARCHVNATLQPPEPWCFERLYLLYYIRSHTNSTSDIIFISISPCIFNFSMILFAYYIALLLISLSRHVSAVASPDVTVLEEGYNVIVKLPCVGCPLFVENTEMGVQGVWEERTDENVLVGGDFRCHVTGADCGWDKILPIMILILGV